MQYHCVQCDERFEVGSDDDKPRCPKCLRQHGLRKLESVSAPRAAGGKPLWLLVAVVLVAGAGFAWWRHTALRGTGPVALGALSVEDLRLRVRNAAGIDAGELADLLTADAKIEAFARRVTADKAKPADKAEAIVFAIAERAKQQAFSVWSRSDPRDTPPMTARQVLAALDKAGARQQLYPLELAAFAVAALRSVDVPALVVEIYRYEGERSALDPSGRLGYYGFALLPATGNVTQAYDAYAARAQAPKPGDFSVLNDVQAVGAALALRAMHRLTNASDWAGALVDAEAAVKLLPSSPSTRSVRGAVLLASGGVDEGTRELEGAAQLRSDAPRHNNLAMLALAKGDGARATKEVMQALGESPDYASAHLTLATVHLASAERDQARAELEKAESLDRDLPALPLAWAELYAGSGEVMQALAKAEEGVRMRPKNPETHLVLARIQRQAGRYDDMRRQAQQVLALATTADVERVKTLIKQVLGPTALEAPTTAEPGTETAVQPTAAAPATDLTVGSGQAAPSGDNAPLVLDQPAPSGGAPGALQLGSGTSKLHLGGSDSKLKLNLSH